MRGLLCKDFMLMQKLMKFIGIYLLAMVVIFYLTVDREEAGSLSMVFGMMSMVLPMFAISSFSYDEQCKWERYAASMPLSRLQIVGEKYLLAILLLAGSMILGVGLVFGANLVYPIDIFQELFTLSVVWLYALFGLSLLLPLIFRFGAEKSRLMMLLVYLLPVMAFLLLAEKFPQMLQLAINPVLLLTVLAAAVFGLFGLSYLLSTKIYRKKEL